MAEEIGFENGRNSNFEGLLTLDPAIRHTVVHHSSTSTYIPNFIQIEETFCGRTYGRTDIFSPSNIIRSTFGSRPNNAEVYILYKMCTPAGIDHVSVCASNAYVYSKKFCLQIYISRKLMINLNIGRLPNIIKVKGDSSDC